MAFPQIPATVMQFITGVLRDLGVPVTNIAVEGFATWLANEQGSDWSAFEANKGNPLGIQTAAAQAAGKAGNMAEGIKLTAQLLKTPTYAGIVESFHRAASVEDIATAVMKSDWSGVGPGNVYSTKGLANFMGAPTGSQGGAGAGGVNIPPTPNIKPIAGADIKNFHGFDLSAFKGTAELGRAEEVIQKYLIDPGYKAQVDEKLRDEYGYNSDWWKKIPEVNAVMIYAALNLDPSAAASKNQFLGLLRNTGWWQTTDANQRAWDQAYGANGAPGSDPAQAQQALGNAQEKVLADANQIGVTLTKQQLDQIAYMYASNNYVQSGSFGAASGTAQEWLDQAIIDTILNVSGQRVGRLPTDINGGAPGTSDFANQTGYLTGAGAPATGATPGNNQTPGSGQNPTGLFGIAAQLYDQFQSLAQQYLMYNPQNPNGGLMNQQTILNWVSQTLKNYTGSGSSFGSSNLIQGGIDQFTNYLKNAAAQYYPGLAESINQGILPSNYAAQYTNLISSSLGVNPASIDYTSPKWNWVLNTPDPKTGVKTPLSLDQVQQKLVTLPQWQTANNTMQMGEGIITALNKQFGFGGT